MLALVSGRSAYWPSPHRCWLYVDFVSHKSSCESMVTASIRFLHPLYFNVNPICVEGHMASDGGDPWTQALPRPATNDTQRNWGESSDTWLIIRPHILSVLVANKDGYHKLVLGCYLPTQRQFANIYKNR